MSKQKLINTVRLEGYIYECKLEEKVTGPQSKNPGTTFISGNLDIATDNELTNIVSVHYTYVTEKTAKGQTNRTFEVLKGIIDGKYGNVMAVGKDKAAKVRIDTAIALNDFYNRENELVSAKRNEGGFVQIVEKIAEGENDRNNFRADMVITNVRRIEADEEHNLPEKMILHGCIFDFKKALLPVDFTILKPEAMDYFESLEPSQKNPVFTKIGGKQISQTIVRTYTEESAFGEDSVRTVTTNRKDWIINYAAKETYSFGTDEDCDMTPAFLAEAMQNREVYLATIKQRQEEYNASKGNTTAAPMAAKSDSPFNF